MNKIRLGWIFCLGLVAALMLTSARPAGADEQDDLYLRVLKIIQQADTLESGGQTGQALDKYREAWKVLQGLKRDNPAWNREAVTYRINYVAEKADTLSRKLATPAKTAPAAAQESASDAASPVKLLEAGAEPRKVLRLHPKPGGTQTLEVTFKMATGMGAGGPSLKLPGIKLALSATVKSVSAEGEITCELAMDQISVLDEPGSAPKLVEEMKKGVSGFKRMSGTLTLSDRGMVKGTQMKASAGTNPWLAQAVDGIKDVFSLVATPLPEQAVGPGAKWEVKTTAVKTQGLTADQTGTIELVSVEDEKITTKSTLTQRAANQKIQNPAMQGVTIDLAKMAVTSTGTATCDLGQILPEKGTVDMHSEVSASADMGGQKQPINTKTDVKVLLQAK